MAASTLDQVIASLQGVYQPQLDAVAAQQAALPGQAAAQTAGINAQKDSAFDGILSQARQRGTGVAFGGIPLGEQAQYTASTFAPALANLQTSQNQQQSSLIDAINKINEDKFNTGNSIYQFGVQQDLAERQFQEQQAEFAAQQAAAARAAAGSGFDPTFGGATASTGTTTQGTADPYAKVDKGGAQKALVSLLNTKNVALINQTLSAIQKSANNGNLYDQYKLALVNGYVNDKNSANNGIANLIRQAQAYKAPAAGKSTTTTYPTVNSSANSSTKSLLGLR